MNASEITLSWLKIPTFSHGPSQVAPEALGAWRVALKPQQRRAWQYFTLCSDLVALRGGGQGGCEMKVMRMVFCSGFFGWIIATWLVV